MNFLNLLAYKFRVLLRLTMLTGIRQIRASWSSNTVNESYQGQATPLEAAAFLTLQNIPRLKNRKLVDHRLRKHIKHGNIRRGVLANGYPELEPQQPGLFESESQAAEPQQATTRDLASLIEEVDNKETQLLAQYAEYDTDDEDYVYDDRPLFLYGLLTGALLTALIPLWMWLSPDYLQFPLKQTERYSPQVIKVAAARGQDCARSIDLYSQLFCGELWRKELSARVEQNYTDLLAVSSAIDDLHRQSGFEVAEPLAARVQRTQEIWLVHLEESCNTAAAVENLGVKRSNRYLECVHSELIARETETREQLNYLRSLGWQEQADDVLNNELIAIRNMAATQAPDKQPDDESKTDETTDEPLADNPETETQAQTPVSENLPDTESP